MIGCARYYPLISSWSQQKLPQWYWKTPRQTLLKAYQDRIIHRELMDSLIDEYHGKLETSYYFDCRSDMQRVDSFYLKDLKNNEEYRFNYRDLNQPKIGDTHIWSLSEPSNQAICRLPDNYYQTPLETQYGGAIVYNHPYSSGIVYNQPSSGYHDFQNLYPSPMTSYSQKKTLDYFLEGTVPVTSGRCLKKPKIDLKKSIENYRRSESLRQLRKRIDF